MSTNPETDTNELDGRTKLLSSRPEPDNILVFGIATLIGLFFCFVAFYFVISEMIEIGWQGLDGFWSFLNILIQAFIICGVPVAYVLMVLDLLIWQIKGKELVTYSDEDLLIQHKSLFSKEWRIPWDCILKVEPFSYPWYKFKGRDGDETLCLTYKNAKGKTKKVRFGLLLNEDQQEIVIKRIKELCVQKYCK
jgi:hypothetical protein